MHGLQTTSALDEDVSQILCKCECVFQFVDSGQRYRRWVRLVNAGPGRQGSYRLRSCWLVRRGRAN